MTTRVDRFSYDLPEELIAQWPPERRDGGRLMLLDRDRGAVTHHQITDLPRLLPPRCLLVVNESKVFPARLWARRETGGRVELLLLEREGCDPASSGSSRPFGALRASRNWHCIARSSKRIRQGETLTLESGAEVRVIDPPTEGRCRVTLSPEVDLDRDGSVPLPPYIQRDDAPLDRERYQTVYATEEGSVAAPTAGLHFTEELLERVEAAGATVARVILHVGPATFQPVRSELVEDHQMGGERYRVPEATAQAIERARGEGRRVVAVGTTVVRALESTGGRAGEGTTHLFITPTHRIKVVDALVTNFHLPRSTLLMLVSALAGWERIRAAYQEAVARRYRFYSYGDAMLIL